MPMNAAWYARHPMPPNATLAQRTKWHVAHAKQCGCRPMPASVQRELERAGTRRPTRRDRAG
jgi:hypothetical protein